MEQIRTSSNSRRRRQHGEAEFSPLRTKSTQELGMSSRAPFGSTIRTVTPESIPEGQAMHAQDVERFIPGSPPTSPGGSMRDSPGQRYHSRAGSNNERSQAMAMRDHAIREQQARPRTRTLDERSHRDSSPTSMLKKHRHGVGSVHSTSSAGFMGVEEDAVTSIGHPAIIAPPYNLPIRTGESSRSKLTKQHLRDVEPQPSPPSRSLSDPRKEPQQHVPRTDTRKILHLMKSTRGRMEGPLAFRRTENAPWSLSYCSINDEFGSLVYEPKTNDSYYRTLIPDLRGCNIRPAWDAESQMPYLDVCPQNSKLKVHLRPHSQDEFDSWFAALLCWQPIRPKGIQNRMTKPVGAAGSDRRPTDIRRHSEVSLLKEAPIIKVGKMIFWDTNVSYSYAGTPKGGKSQPSPMQSFGSRRWRRVSCTLRENGELKLYSEQDVTMVSCVQLSQLCRCAVQRLDASVLDNDFCIAIYPQYSATANQQDILQPIFLSLESRVLYEVWLVLLRAFTIPQLYGPKQLIDERFTDLNQQPQSPIADMFRMERSLSLRVIEARLLPPVSPMGHEHNERPKPEKKNSQSTTDHGGYHVEVLLDGETRGKTMVKDEALNPFWREEFEFTDLPAVLSVASILLRKRPPSHVQNERTMHKEMRRIHDTLNSSDGGGGQTGISFDQTCGKVDIYLDDLEAGKAVEKWWPLMNSFSQTIGDVLVSVTTEESVILMARDYQPMSELLHRFSNGLTLQLAQMVNSELRRLSEYLLNIFQVSGSASDWIMSLVEEEIDGTQRETPTSRLRFSRRANSNDSSEGTQFGPIIDREIIVRDMGKSATLEANLLFRGNTLLTKSLDLHMKRLGKEYLEETLGDKLKEIADKDPDCEVDPNRVHNLNDLDRNWRKLINFTTECWRLIANSAAKCPPELRIIFRHIRACAEDRYGDFLRTVAYSSVSGFLFLRFFVPAILNPKLFGLLKDHPKSNSRRTLTLIAKSLQGLANLTTFGSKEQWMEPMNVFISSHRLEFKGFLDQVCSISTTSMPLVPIPPSYSTPLAILTRLPPTSREGFPSLPYLIDHARNFAALVALWLDHAGNVGSIQESDGDLLKFHKLVVSLRQRTEECLASAERAERPSSSLSFQWEELVEQLENTSTHAGPRSMPHSRMNSATVSNSGQQSLPDSPTQQSRDLSVEIPRQNVSRTRSKSNQAQANTHSSPTSNTTSPYSTDDSQPGDDDQVEGATTTRNISIEEASNRGYASIASNQKVPRTMYGYAYTDSRTKSREALKLQNQSSSRQFPQQPKQAKRECSVGAGIGMASTMNSDSVATYQSTTLSSSYRDERSWLGDKASNSGEDDRSSAWSGERAYGNRSYRSESERNGGSSVIGTPITNARPTRKLDGHERHVLSALQKEADAMEPGDPRDWTPRRGQPRRDWSATDDRRQKRVDRNDFTSISRDGGSRDGSFVFGPSMQQAFQQSQSRSRPGSTPGSRLQSRQPSISESEGEEGTTALPRMSHIQRPETASGMIPSRERNGSDRREREEGSGGGGHEKEREKEKHIFDRLGFKKRKG